ncbi:hypothetical protein E2562_003331 [Oryza meyeriana var. granulata]|uniref:Uncharacterized protein n=1 Tax=Oryza meyeriana var. granulata TaxID=110450 RepID=A0A6G1EE99_9ORYZ|nr:hypothetical protein E2562_003331 [Oryza meyeriana var. granulata]
MLRGDGITVNLERMARGLMQRQEEAASDEQHRMMVSSHRLSRVPAHLRDANSDAYTPRFVSIGPLHRGDARRLGAGERLKMAYLHSLISRGHTDQARQLAVIQDYLRVVATREREARAFYSEDVDMYAEEFIQMLVLDGCFIVEHLVNVAIGREEPSLHATPFGPVQLSIDLILAENQIPFFVLVDLVRSTKLPEFELTGHSPPVWLMKLVLYYLAGEKGRDMGDALPPVEGVAHILHLLHAMVTAARKRWEPPPRIQDGADVPSASDLKRMWVRFKKAPRGSGAAVTGIASVMGPVPLAVKLAHEDKLRLPQLQVEFRTAPLLLNLMAFEQSTAKPEEQEVSAYVSFMAKMRSRHPLFMMWADVKRNYFTVPWAVVAEFVAFVSFVSTIVQMYSSFKQK